MGLAVRSFQRSIRLIAALLAVVLPGLPAGGEGVAVDLELVFAVDASGSVDDREYRMQLRGLALALRDPAVKKAMRSGPRGSIAAAMVVWAEHQVPKDTTGWYRLASDGDADRLAAAIEAFPRNQSGATGIGEGVAAALREIEINDFIGERQVVDVSGDGRETPARDYVVLMPQARAMAIHRGVTINGLAIVNEDRLVAPWYREMVVTGPDSFLVIAEDYEDFARAIRQKLFKEIEWRPRLSDRSM